MVDNSLKEYVHITVDMPERYSESICSWRTKRVRRRVASKSGNVVQTEISKNEQRNRLLELGSESLVAAILELSARNPDAADMIGQLISEPNEKVERILKKLEAFKDIDEFYDWRRLTALSLKLDSLLSEIKIIDACPPAYANPVKENTDIMSL